MLLSTKQASGALKVHRKAGQRADGSLQALDGSLPARLLAGQQLHVTLLHLHLHVCAGSSTHVPCASTSSLQGKTVVPEQAIF